VCLPAIWAKLKTNIAGHPKKWTSISWYCECEIDCSSHHQLQESENPVPLAHLFAFEVIGPGLDAEQTNWELKYPQYHWVLRGHNIHKHCWGIKIGPYHILIPFKSAGHPEFHSSASELQKWIARTHTRICIGIHWIAETPGLSR